mmetsp:Transcript_23503/g.59427  ORF Transcript_23503/g.59427 Transcript_23503/m.59427 type:complete len:262 (+) Transcript_23503:1387-2172(+)
MMPSAARTLSCAPSSARALRLCPCTRSSSSSSPRRSSSLPSFFARPSASRILGSIHPMTPVPSLSPGPTRSPAGQPTLVAPSHPRGLTVRDSYGTKMCRRSSRGRPAAKKTIAETLPSHIPPYTSPLHSVKTSAETTGRAPSAAHVPLAVTLPHEAESSSQPGATHVQLRASNSTFSCGTMYHTAKMPIPRQRALRTRAAAAPGTGRSTVATRARARYRQKGRPARAVKAWCHVLGVFPRKQWGCARSTSPSRMRSHLTKK